MSREKFDEVLTLINTAPIEINYGNAVNYKNCRNYDQNVMSQGFTWHQIVINHNGKMSYHNGKKMILDAIFDTIGNEEFYPVHYRRKNREDCFLVRQCTSAMDKLFAKNLRIRLENGQNVALEVQLNVATYNFEQISPKTKISQALNRLCQKVQSEMGILNLSSFSENIEFIGLEISLNNLKVMEYVCDLINRDDTHFRHIKGITLSHNELKTVAPLQIFRSSVFTILDLRHNNLQSISNLCKDLQNVKAKKLLLAGNPLTTLTNYPAKLSPLAKNFKFLEETPFNTLSKYFTPADRENTSNDGRHQIKSTNREDIQRFGKSSDWHAVTVPDPNHEFTKEEIFDYFFLQVSKELEVVYPCYYKYISGDHQFLLRNCYRQLAHFVEVCNMEIKIPSMNVISLDDEEQQNQNFQVTYEKSIKCHLIMNIATFKQGDIEPVDIIQKALSQCFNGMDRILDLQKFQNTPGLENIIINMSLPVVLCNIMSLAAREFSSSWVEIRLSQNKILSLNFENTLFLMANVKAIDLANNWIHDLEDIASLKVMKLKALCLDGNPVCSKYTNPTDYINAVKNVFPEIHKLDNVEIKTTGNINFQKNYVCDVKVYDFVEQFVPCFFNTFGSADRQNLKGLYHSNALFSLTCKYKPVESTAQNINRREKYRIFNRNVLSLQDISIAQDYIHHGQKEILKVFNKLPDMCFDLLSFTVDVPVFCDNMIVLIVTGVFSDQPNCLLEGDIIMGFARTFVLAPEPGKVGVLKHAKSYKILNDLLSVYNPSESQVENSFKFSTSIRNDKNDEVTVVDKEALLIMFQEISGLKNIWCTRCLEDAKWDFEEAMEVFLNLLNKKDIPETAFL